MAKLGPYLIVKLNNSKLLFKVNFEAVNETAIKSMIKHYRSMSIQYLVFLTPKYIFSDLF